MQTAMQKIAEQLVLRGHDVTVATSYYAPRESFTHNGVVIRDFKVSGNYAHGMHGEIKKFQDFVLGFECDALLVKAAQQWTFDALWAILPQIKPRKIFIPCGFSGLPDHRYSEYFKILPNILRQLDYFIFYSDTYRDIEFVRNTGLSNYTVLPNGACWDEFNAPINPTFDKQLGISADDVVLLNVASLGPAKGQLELLQSFFLLKSPKGRCVLILNARGPENFAPACQEPLNGTSGPRKITVHINILAKRLIRIGPLLYKGWEYFLNSGLRSTLSRTIKYITSRATAPSYAVEIEQLIRRINKDPNKLVLHTDLSRQELIQAFYRSDLFVFTSKIEYSPLVLYEAAAAGVPFLSTPAGNAKEIANWTKGGWIVPDCKEINGVTECDVTSLTKAIEALLADPIALHGKGLIARQRWEQFFSWSIIATHYEQILANEPLSISDFRH